MGPLWAPEQHTLAFRSNALTSAHPSQTKCLCAAFPLPPCPAPSTDVDPRLPARGGGCPLPRASHGMAATCTAGCHRGDSQDPVLAATVVGESQHGPGDGHFPGWRAGTSVRHVPGRRAGPSHVPVRMDGTTAWAGAGGWLLPSTALRVCGTRGVVCGPRGQPQVGSSHTQQKLPAQGPTALLAWPGRRRWQAAKPPLMAPIPQPRVRALRPGADKSWWAQALLCSSPRSPHPAPTLLSLDPMVRPQPLPRGPQLGAVASSPLRCPPGSHLRAGLAPRKAPSAVSKAHGTTPGLYTDPPRHPPPPKQLSAFQDLLPAEQTPQACPAHSHEAPTPPPPPSIPSGCSRGHRGTPGELKPTPPWGSPWLHPLALSILPAMRLSPAQAPRCCGPVAPSRSPRGDAAPHDAPLGVVACSWGEGLGR